jgi:hypothetical protein
MVSNLDVAAQDLINVKPSSSSRGILGLKMALNVATPGEPSTKSKSPKVAANDKLMVPESIKLLKHMCDEVASDSE